MLNVWIWVKTVYDNFESCTRRVTLTQSGIPVLSSALMMSDNSLHLSTESMSWCIFEFMYRACLHLDLQLALFLRGSAGLKINTSAPLSLNHHDFTNTKPICTK